MWRGLALLVGTALASCGPCDVPPADVDAGPDLANLDLDAQALCVTLYRGFSRQLRLSGVGAGACSTPSSEPVDLSDLDSEETTARLQAGCRAGNVIFDGLDVALRGGRVRFDLAAMEACMAAGRAVINGAPISDENGEARMAEINAAFAASPCPEAATGLVEQGAACEQPWDCADAALVCEPETPTGAARACRAPAAQGEACRDSVGQSLPIRSCAEGSSCQAGVCSALLSEGVTCSADRDCQDGLDCGAGDVCRPPSGNGGPCEPYLHSQCAEGLSCRADATCGPPRAVGELCGSVSEACADCTRCLSLDGEIRCRARPLLGERCDGTFDCADGLWCDDSVGPGVCATVVGAGGDCSASIFACDDELDCTDDVCLAQVGLGGDCTVARCQDELHCVEGACRAGGVGDPCADSSDCDDDQGAVCTVELACGAPRAAGGACAADDQCAAELFCDNGACGALPGAGVACAAGRCASSAYCDVDDACVAKGQGGEQCNTDAQCASGFCAAGATCGVTPVTCWAAPGIFETMLFFAVLAPLRLRQLRRWRER